MVTKRIIPCLDVRNGRVVKGTNFEGIKDVADPVEMARLYNAAGADELVFYDITASFEGRALFTDILTQVASEIFIPLTVGGGINTLEDFDRVLKCGADKVSVNSGALKNPDLIPAAAQRYGDQCVVLSADVKRVNGQFRVFAKGGREDTGRDALGWIAWCTEHGAGEVCLNSIDTDGVVIRAHAQQNQVPALARAHRFAIDIHLCMRHALHQCPHKALLSRFAYQHNASKGPEASDIVGGCGAGLLHVPLCLLFLNQVDHLLA